MDLNNIEEIKKLDTGQVAESIEFLPDQFRQVLDESRLIKIPASYTLSTPTFSKLITNVVVNGMGGSNIGAKILKSAFADKLKLPLLIEPGYEVPAYVNKNTLYIISSYSGNTEEPLNAYEKAKKRGAKIVGITSYSSKNKLAKLMLKENIPGYVFNPKFNPSNQPRLGLGYTLFGTAIILSKAGVLKINKNEIKNIIAFLEIETRKLKPEAEDNPAKKIAQKLYDKTPILVAAEFLAGNIEALRNQMSENSKHLPMFLTLPDLNHFAMEGLSHPVSNKKNMIFLFFDSELYRPRIQKRSELTKQIVKKNNIEVASHLLKGKTKLEQSFELLQLGTWITYYLGMLHKVNPSKIPYVDWFKEQLK